MSIDFTVPSKVLASAKISADDLMLELAVYLYDKERLSMGQAKNLAQVDLPTFQRELAKRNVYIKYGVDDLQDDLNTLDNLRS